MPRELLRSWHEAQFRNKSGDGTLEMRHATSRQFLQQLLCAIRSQHLYYHRPLIQLREALAQCKRDILVGIAAKDRLRHHIGNIRLLHYRQIVVFQVVFEISVAVGHYVHRSDDGYFWWPGALDFEAQIGPRANNEPANAPHQATGFGLPGREALSAQTFFDSTGTIKLRKVLHWSDDNVLKCVAGSISALPNRAPLQPAFL